MHKLAQPLRQAVQDALSRAVRNHRPHYDEINWGATIKTNLRHYQDGIANGHQPAQQANRPCAGPRPLAHQSMKGQGWRINAG